MDCPLEELTGTPAGDRDSNRPMVQTHSLWWLLVRHNCSLGDPIHSIYCLFSFSPAFFPLHFSHVLGPGCKNHQSIISDWDTQSCQKRKRLSIFTNLIVIKHSFVLPSIPTFENAIQIVTPHAIVTDLSVLLPSQSSLART